MLTLFRRFLDTWAAKLFFFVLVGAFGLWGVADVVRNLGTDGAMVVVGSRKIQLDEVQDAYRRQLAQVARMFGADSQPTPDIKKAVAAQALERLITTAALQNKAADMGLAVPDDAVRQAVFDIPAFKGPNGSFDRATFEQVLRNNSLTENRFLDMVRTDLGQKQILEAIRAGVTVPDVLSDAVFDFQREQRAASAVDLPFTSAPQPAPPTDAQLQRYYENNTDRYTTVEFRRIKAVVLAPETLASDVSISDADIAAAYESRKAEFNTPEKRSVEVLLAPDQATAQKLADAWSDGASWAAIQQQGTAAGASAVELNDALQTEFPAPELGAAVFAASLNTVPAPVHSALGWHVLKVTAITPGITKTLAEVTPELRAKLAADKAADLIYARANKVEDALAAGTTLDDLPGDLGLAAITGTLDANGNTTEGKPAPIPGPASLRPALIQAAFQAKKGDAPHLTQAPNAPDGSESFYAVTVEDIIPPAPKPFEAVIDRVRADWTHDAVRHTEETVAAQLLAAVNGGKTLADAAAAAGLRVQPLPPTGRDTASLGMPTQLLTPLFGMKPGEATMVELPDGFMVAVLDRIIPADPASDPAGFAQMKEALTRAIADDTEQVYASAVRNQANPKVNRSQLDSIVQAE
jgi:peptidyl-prolyl cis-trans isomerase D